MRLELTRVGLLVELANHYTTRGAWIDTCVSDQSAVSLCVKSHNYFYTHIHTYICTYDEYKTVKFKYEL